MKKFLLLISVLILSINYVQSQEKKESSKININVKTKTVKAIPVDTLDSFLVKKTPKPEIIVAKNYLKPKSDSFFDMTVYLIIKQFQDSPIISWILTFMLGFWILRMIKRLFEKVADKK